MLSVGRRELPAPMMLTFFSSLIMAAGVDPKGGGEIVKRHVGGGILIGCFVTSSHSRSIPLPWSKHGCVSQGEVEFTHSLWRGGRGK